MCYYRNITSGNVTLIDSSKIVRTPYSFTARNITLSGVIPDTNFYLVGYNMTATYYFGNGTYLVDVNDTLSQLNCANGQVVKWNNFSSLWYCSDISAPGEGDIDAVNTDNLYLIGGATQGEVNLSFNETKLNQTIDQKISTYNLSLFSWVTSRFTSLSNLVNSLGNWSGEKINYYNKTQVDTNITNANTSVNNYINYTNASMKNYVDTTFVNQSGVGNLSVNNSQYLNNYSSDFFMPLNKSVYGDFNFTGQTNFNGQVDFNGGWLNDGLSILNGNLYAKTGYFYNISSLSVYNLNINGSLLPYSEDFGEQFDIGSEDLKWKDLYLSGQVNAVTANISGDIIVAGVSFSQNNDSMRNYVNWNNESVTNYISSIASIGEPLWNYNYSEFLTKINWSQVMNGTL
ncbi:MAG: hypothetical protein NTZ83_04170, partial [Candidatus Pacearchaeota archaeon]|nr:hypothetical protein [Candidatus Pacearchaeota archaeon]